MVVSCISKPNSYFFHFFSRTTLLKIQIAKSSGIAFLPHKRRVYREFEHALALSKYGPAPLKSLPCFLLPQVKMEQAEET